jgi:putative flavoprotein involved in K+ transport
MDLDVWTDAECLSADFDNACNEWHLRVSRSGHAIDLYPKQVVFATGNFGQPKFPNILGMQRFRGEQHHACTHRIGGRYKGLRCVVVGSGTTAHDICAELWEAGADVLPAFTAMMRECAA